jgi:hypothetical protein
LQVDFKELFILNHKLCKKARGRKKLMLEMSKASSDHGHFVIIGHID